MTDYPVMVTIHEVTALRAEVARLTSENALLREPFDGVYLQGAELAAVRKLIRGVAEDAQYCEGAEDGYPRSDNTVELAVTALSISAPKPGSMEDQWVCAKCGTLAGGWMVPCPDCLSAPASQIEQEEK